MEICFEKYHLSGGMHSVSFSKVVLFTLLQSKWKVQLWICKLSWQKIFYGGLLRDQNWWCWWRDCRSVWSVWWWDFVLFQVPVL